MEKQANLLSEQMRLLREVISERSPDLLPLLDNIGVILLSDEQREALRITIGIEFCETGLQEDSESNERGIALEKIIDLLGHL